MIRYTHTQFGWVIAGGLLMAGAVTVVAALSHSFDQQTKSLLLFLSFLIFLFLLLFHSLKTTVTDTAVQVAFGVGLVHKVIPLEAIESCEVKRSQIVLGWGIRFGRGFTLWNVSGFHAVELTLKNRKWKFRIGTNEPERLCEALTSAMQEQAH